ncbi:10356_t:CDS:2 [Funneliformis geosporum]|nr:10356_t:CDS:2 [Funneliformis geosporum]
MGKNELQKELLERVKPGAKPSDIKKKRPVKPKLSKDENYSSGENKKNTPIPPPPPPPSNLLDLQKQIELHKEIKKVDERIKEEFEERIIKLENTVRTIINLASEEKAEHKEVVNKLESQIKLLKSDNLESKTKQLEELTQRNKELENSYLELKEHHNKLEDKQQEQEGLIYNLGHKLKFVNSEKELLVKELVETKEKIVNQEVMLGGLEEKLKGVQENNHNFIKVLTTRFTPEQIREKWGNIYEDWLTDDSFEVLSKEDKKKIEFYDKMVAEGYLDKLKETIRQISLLPIPKLVKHTASHEGMFAYVKQAGDVYRIASVNNIISNDAGEIEKANVTYKNLYGASGGGSMQREDLTNMKDVIIGFNTYEMVPDTNRINRDLENYLDYIFKSDVFDLEAARPRMFIRTNIFPESPERKRLEDNVRAFNVVVFSSLENSQRAYGLYREIVGMVYNTGKTPQTERQPVAEIKMVEGQFASPENIRLQSIETFLRECYSKIGGNDYTLITADGSIAFQIGDDYLDETKDNGDKVKDKEVKVDDKDLERLEDDIEDLEKSDERLRRALDKQTKETISLKEEVKHLSISFKFGISILLPTSLMEKNKIYNLDCLELFKRMKSEGMVVDAIITDPPYKISRKNNFATIGRNGIDFDIANVLEEVGCEIKDLIRWKKTNPMPRNINRRYVTDFEMAYLRPEYIGSVVLGKNRLHPTQKNLSVIKEIVKTHTNEGDLVLDPFMGSGTLAVACQELGRN